MESAVRNPILLAKQAPAKKTQNVKPCRIKLLLNNHIKKPWDAWWKDHYHNLIQPNNRHQLSQSFTFQDYWEPAEFSNRTSSRHCTAVWSMFTGVTFLFKYSYQQDGNTVACWQWRKSESKTQVPKYFCFPNLKKIPNKLFWKTKSKSSVVFDTQAHNKLEFKG